MQGRLCREKLKKSLLKNTLKNSPFDMEVLAQKYWGKTLREMRKTGFNSPKSCIKLAKMASFYRATKTSHWGKSPGQMTYWSTGRSTDQGCRSTAWSTAPRSWLLAQRPITLVLMMINSCSYSTHDLVFNKFQIFDQDLSRCLA